jgi:hypothetical protein
VGAGLDPVQIGLLTELYWGMPPRSYIRTRAWGPDDLERGWEALASAGWVDANGFTEAGRAFREQIETATDQAEAPLLAAIGDDLDELFGLLEPWAKAIVEAKGYPQGPRGLTVSR